MRSFLLLCLLCVVGSASSLQAQDKPNVIVILTDDQGWGDLSFNGNKNLSTPNIDELARQGASFDRFFVCPVCSPTRAEFMTGRYHPHSGVYSTSAGGERMDLDESTIAETFKAAGYRTAAFGKWHNGMQYPYHPNARGFDEYYGFCSGHWGHYFSPMLERNGKITRGKGFVIDDFTNEAIKFIEANRDRPFFVYLPFNTPHSPMQVPDRYWESFKDKKLEMRHREPRKENLPHVRAALAMCENIDWNVGRLMESLRSLRLENDTIFVYFCDNGPNGSRWNGGMKGRKGSTDEGGVRSPLFVRWPGKIQAGRSVEPIASVTDLLPTLASLAGIQVKSKKPLDGKSLSPLLLDEEAEWEDRMIFSHWRNRVSVRTQQFRFDHRGKLYDMEKDPGQYTDVSKQHPQVAARFEQAVRDWKEQVLKGYDDDQRPFVVGHPAAKYTQVPARDGTAHGNIKRSNRFPNCSYFTNWISLDDKITWTAEVPVDGKFRVELFYACPATDIGSTIELSFQGEKVSRKIDVAHDPPLVGAKQDRVKRTESYVKAFRPLDLGVLSMKKGKGELTLKATEKPGNQVIEFRLLQFTRVE